jgi:hypothetical protein
MSLTIRRARPGEAGLVLSLARELAEYEKLLHEVEATEAMIEVALSRLQWSVLDWNAPSIEFYKSLGAVLMDEWTVCRIGGPALTALAQGAR